MQRGPQTVAFTGQSMPRPRPRASRHHRARRTALLLGSLAALAFAAGAVLGAGNHADERALATRYVHEWERKDYPAMYRLLSFASRALLNEPAFAAAYRRTAATATLQSLRLVRTGGFQDGRLRVEMLVRTLVFGSLREPLLVGFDSSGSAISYDRALLFPGLRPGEGLSRRSTLGARGAILAADGEALAEGPSRYSPIPAVAQQIVGTLGPIPLAERAAYAAAGYPADAQIGQNGLELVFQHALAGRPGGTLLAGGRVLARVGARPGKTVRTTIVPALEQAASTALGGRYGGIIALNPRTGGVMAAAGIAWSDAQPPGSTMKIITSSAALSAGIVKLGTVFPIQTGATLDGYTLHNAGSEACGGTLINAFAVSCNSVFVPLGAQLGGPRLVAMALRFGFDEPPPFAGALESVIPPASQIGDALAVGSSAIGQGRVLASPLEMADVAATIADHGRRPIPTLDASQRPRFVPVISAHVANEVQQMMLAVVSYGTGTPAQIPGVAVAAKTGTAETANTGGRQITADTDSWFVAYAPAGAPKIVAAALFPAAGYGAATAAPAIRAVLLAGLQG
jgi:peptidoglycan glycosyltransferase